MSTKTTNSPSTAAMAASDESTPNCPPGTHFDQASGTCVADQGGQGILSESVAASSANTDTDDKA